MLGRGGLVGMVSREKGIITYRGNRRCEEVVGQDCMMNGNICEGDALVQSDINTAHTCSPKSTGQEPDLPPPQP